MLLKLNRLTIAKSLIGISVIATTGSLFAQWGTNAQRCPDGRCAPNRKNWGYYETQWRRWPNAPYPDMIAPPAKPGGDQIPPGTIELPNPINEAEVQTPSATRGPTRVAPQTGAPPESTRSFESMPSPTGSGFSTPESSELRRPAMPIEEPPFSTPSVPESAPALPEPTPATLNPQSNTIPKPRLRPGSPTAPVAAVSPALSELRGQKVSWTETQKNAHSQKAVIHPSATAPKRTIEPNDEPELIVPSLNSRPIEASAFRASDTWRAPEVASEAESSRSIEPTRPIEGVKPLDIPPVERRTTDIRLGRGGINPLREDPNVDPASAISDPNSTSFGVIRADGGSMPNAVRGNPLRRN